MFLKGASHDRVVVPNPDHVHHIEAGGVVLVPGADPNLDPRANLLVALDRNLQPQDLQASPSLDLEVAREVDLVASLNIDFLLVYILGRLLNLTKSLKLNLFSFYCLIEH